MWPIPSTWKLSLINLLYNIWLQQDRMSQIHIVTQRVMWTQIRIKSPQKSYVQSFKKALQRARE